MQHIYYNCTYRNIESDDDSITIARCLQRTESFCEECTKAENGKVQIMYIQVLREVQLLMFDYKPIIDANVFQ